MIFSTIFFYKFHKKTLKKFAVFFVFAFYFLASAWVRPIENFDQFSDLGNYFNFWSEIEFALDRAVFFQYEPGFVLICKILTEVINFSSFLFVVQMVVGYSMFLLFSKYMKNIALAGIFAFICITFYDPVLSLSTLVIRQGLATAIFFVFLANYRDGITSWKRSLIWLLLMCLFHYSSVFVLFCFSLIYFIPGLGVFYLWLIAMFLYGLDISGKVGFFLYEAMQLNVTSLSALSSGSDIDYVVGFKPNFLFLNIFYVIVTIFIVKLGKAKKNIREVLSGDIFRIYFSLNAIATIFSLLPFYDRFFMWSWAIGPFLLVAASVNKRTLVYASIY